jgi:alkanesulfonate monooxygenase SsuD/methylene tetrahydromethanopterin reductase-like flavin-dependent oxidoreductase (luciferase family)
MKYGMSVPNFGWFGDIDLLVDFAVEAEEAGWDGFFLWDHLLVFKENPTQFVDPWVALSAIACNTKKLRIGPHITPVPRRRPWIIAREAVTLDHLSKGRLTLGVGIGAPPDPEYVAFGEEPSAKIRAEKLDEGLDIITGLWTGKPFSFSGKHFYLDDVTFLPTPFQKPRIPIWVGGGVPHKAPFKRAARYDGVSPVHSEWPTPVEVSHLEDVLDIVKAERGNLENYDVSICGETTGSNHTRDQEIITSWIDAGLNWWLEDIHGLRAGIDELRERIRAGPPLS